MRNAFRGRTLAKNRLCAGIAAGWTCSVVRNLSQVKHVYCMERGLFPYTLFGDLKVFEVSWVEPTVVKWDEYGSWGIPSLTSR